MAERDGFLRRWSQRKAATRRHGGARPVLPDAPVPKRLDAVPEPSVGAADTEPAPSVPDRAETEAAVPVPENLPDIETLTADSDFSVFLGKGVPEELSRRALRKLWRTDPVLANLDGLLDYDDDFTAAAHVGEVVRTVYRAGKGMLGDEAAEPAAAGAAGTDEAGPPDPPASADDAAAEPPDSATADAGAEQDPPDRDEDRG